MSPALGEDYKKLLEWKLDSLRNGRAFGFWNTTVYLMGEKRDYRRLRHLWAAIYSQPTGSTETVRTFDSSDVIEFARTWAVPEVSNSNEYWCHPYKFQTWLNSDELAHYIQLPHQEVTGYEVRSRPSFDVVTPAVATETPSVRVGLVQAAGRTTSTWYELSPNQLTEHAFIAGITGSGKTNTTIHLLQQLRVPFLVLEPAKQEYGDHLLAAYCGGALNVLKVWTGNSGSELRLNPFEPIGSTHIGTHIDLLKSAFCAAFSMESPLPEILSICLRRVFEVRGWDIASGTNVRDEPFANDAIEHEERHDLCYPTMTDFLTTVENTTSKLEYKGDVFWNIKTALSTRLRSLVAGGKGQLFECRRSTPIATMLQRPTVIQLEELGDDEDKSFVMALILMRLFQYRRTEGYSSNLKHLLVIEEAHRLVPNVPRVGSDISANNTRGKAVDSFCNLLAEIRA